MNIRMIRTVIVLIAMAVLSPALLRAQDEFDGVPAAAERPEPLAVSFEYPYLHFSVSDGRAVMVRLLILDRNGHLLSDSGEIDGAVASWDASEIATWESEGQPLVFELRAWDDAGRLIQRLSGEVVPPSKGGENAQLASTYNVAGNFTIGGFLGVGTYSPQRAIHIFGSNAVFRMDRSQDTAAFMIVRNNTAGNILKTYVVGVNASGTGNGSFVINDLGATASGSGTNRLTIDNTGVAIFGGTVKATGFVTTSSRQFKTDIQPLRGALDKVMHLQGVSFRWKDGGAPAIGMIAEDTAAVAPEVVAYRAGGQPAGIDYGRVSALLVESVKSQQAEIEQLKQDCAALEARLQKELRAVNKDPRK